MKAAIYARESSDDTKKAPPISEQIDRARAWAQENKIDIVQIFQDDGWSGGDWRRPAWNDLVGSARARAFVQVIVFAQDRLARDTEQFLWFYRQLRERGCAVYSLTEGEINMETAGDRLKHTSIAMASEAFRLITSEKVKRTFEAKKKKAEALGERVVWGRSAYPSEIAETVIRLKVENPMAGHRKIAAMLPLFKLKNGREVRPSHVWVKGVLSGKSGAVPGTLGVKKTPSEPAEVSAAPNPPANQ